MIKREYNFENINNARVLLDIKEVFTIEEIKTAYHNKIKEYHPDKNKNDNNAHWKTIEIMNAYEILIKYCQKYKFSLKKEDFLKQNPISYGDISDLKYASWWQDQYGKDPLWGNDLDA